MIKKQSLLRLAAFITVGASLAGLVSHNDLSAQHRRKPHGQRRRGLGWRPHPGRKPGRLPIPSHHFGPGRGKHKRPLFNLISNLTNQLKKIKQQTNFNQAAIRDLNDRSQQLEQELKITQQIASALTNQIKTLKQGKKE